jgi:hypothetical protein
MTAWSLNGTYFESCNCEAACPCLFLSRPTTGDCTVLVGWHIDKGKHDSVTLDGLNVALAVHSPGHMAQVKWNAAVYLDDRASEAQQKALTQIFAGQAGGVPAALAAHVGKILGARTAKIEFEVTGRRHRLTIDDIAEMEIAPIAGQNGGEVRIQGHPLAVSPGHDSVICRSTKLRYQDHGMRWELTEKTGQFAPFSYSG